MRLHVLHKPVGQTPLEALEAYRKKSGLSPLAKLTYAGRLDPMASGVLLILEGATQVQKERYLALPKTYQAQILFGFATDSFDLLGLPSADVIPTKVEGSLNSDSIKKTLNSFQGKTLLPLPTYSSVIYKGKPLHYWARNKKNIRLPKREMEVQKIKLVGCLPDGKAGKQISSNNLLKYIKKNIAKVNGDFRQKEILKAWNQLLAQNKNKYLLSTLLISCSSGTYIRSISNELGKQLGTKAVLFSLKREKIGSIK